ncbi:hypothetical protein LX99_01042 [Mucilaginibacter oryzae]|uniref:Uncharacterized protein n=1 Tax=Mucilaginibacter oryzae TaxID=468058 RepID=A0A316HK92_9SPHI|nr:hypothetical protein [Mucilaginibacter oryzae]PWK80573.1 hypothetical protein LX99_01042 [Mucilaginibacter oryzae]
MTTVIIKFDSDKKTLLLMQLAEELGLSVKTQEFVELDALAMARGIGSKATDEELINYLNKDIDEEGIPLEQAFAKYNK